MKKIYPLIFVVMLVLTPVRVLAQETYTVNFKDAEIKELVKFIADSMGYTVIIDPKVKGKVELISSEPVTQQELYDLFLAVLDTHGYAAVKNGNLLRIIPDKNARTSAIPVVSKLKRSNSEFVTQVMELDNVSATKLIPVLRPLVPQQGHMAAYADTNAIIISAPADIVDKVQKIVSKVDKSSHAQTEIIKLEHATSEETVRILTQVLNPKGAGDKNTAEDRVTLVADTRSNSIVVSGSEQTRLKVYALISQLDVPLENIGNARVFYLHYANAKELAPILSKVAQNMSNLDGGPGPKGKSAGGVASIEADEATNSLIITGNAEVLEGLKSIIERLDIPRAQVLVEAIIVEVNQKDGIGVGFDFFVGNKDGGFGGSNQTPGLLGNIAAGAFQDDDEDVLEGVAAALAGVPGGVWGGTDFNVSGTSFAAVLTALESTGETNILSTPSLMTLDNNEASIVVGQEVPFVTGSYTSTGASGSSSSNPGNPFQTINRENVGVTLTVTPHVNEGDQLTLKIVQEVSGLEGSTNELSTADIVTNERRIETTVSAKDGEIIVLGGLISDEVQETISKVPVLGDIPIVGRLFKSSSTSVFKKNLMVFIKPTVVRDSQTAGEVSKDSYKQIRGTQLYKKARGVDLYDEDVLPVLPKWEQQVKDMEALKKRAAKAAEEVDAEAEEVE